LVLSEGFLQLAAVGWCTLASGDPFFGEWSACALLQVGLRAVIAQGLVEWVAQVLSQEQVNALPFLHVVKVSLHPLKTNVSLPSDYL